MLHKHVWVDKLMAKGTYFGSAIDFQYKVCVVCPGVSLSVVEDHGYFVRDNLQDALEIIQLVKGGRYASVV